MSKGMTVSHGPADIAVLFARALGFLMLLALALCINGCSESGRRSHFIPTPSVEELLMAPEEVSFGGRTYTMSTALWRDFMPCVGGGSCNNGLIASITISETGMQKIPADVDAVYMWIINRDEVWATPFSDEDRPGYQEFELNKIARHGPSWDIGIDVEVVVNLKSDSGIHYLRAANQVVTAVY